MHAITVVQVVAALGAFAQSGTRFFAATKAFWSRSPKLAQWLPPALVFLPALGSRLSSVASWSDLAYATVIALGLAFPGTHSHMVGDGGSSDDAPADGDDGLLTPPPKPSAPLPPLRAALVRIPAFIALLALLVCLPFCGRSSTDLAAPCDSMTLASLTADCRTKVRANCARDAGIVDEACPTLITCDAKIKTWLSCHVIGDAGPDGSADSGAR